MNGDNSKTQAVEASVLEFVCNELVHPAHRDEVDRDADLLGQGLIDSMGMMRLVTFVEEEFALSIPPEDVTIENFVSVREIAAYVKKSQ